MKVKIKSVELYKKKAFQENDSYNILVDGDDRRFSYLCQGEPKLKAGEDADVEIENKGKDGKDFWKIKLVQQPFQKGSGFKQKPSNVFALELARRMYNSSAKTTDKWDADRMLKTADWLVAEINKGISRDAIECATTIECANAMNEIDISAKEMAKHIKLFDEWLKKQ